MPQIAEVENKVVKLYIYDSNATLMKQYKMENSF